MDRYTGKNHSPRSAERLGDVDIQGFSDTTISTLRSLLSRGVLTKVYGPISTGKEAVVLRARLKGGDCALKIFRLTSPFRATKKYFRADPRYENPKIARMRSDRRSVVMEWAKKEHHNLLTAKEIGLPVPRPILIEKNILAMDFLGSGGIPYPTLHKSTGLLRKTGNESSKRMWQQIWECLLIMFKHSFVHGDLSPYNILWDQETDSIFFIDISQSYISKEVEKDDFFRSDVENIASFFQGLGLPIDPSQLYREIMLQSGVAGTSIESPPEVSSDRTYTVFPVRNLPHILNNHSVLQRLEEVTGAKIMVGVDDSQLQIGSSSHKELEMVREILWAMEIGFSYRVALRLSYPDVYIRDMHASSVIGSKKNAQKQMGRVIGRNGEVKEAIEKYSGTAICIRGSKATMIGTPLQIQLAAEAIERILRGKAQEDSILYLKEHEREHYFELHPL